MASTTTALDKLSTPEAKVSLFRSLFRGRDDVFPRRWNGKGFDTSQLLRISDHLAVSVAIEKSILSPVAAKPWMGVTDIPQ